MIHFEDIRFPRLMAVLLGIGLLASFELVLRAAGVGDYRDRPDAFAGFAKLSPTFRLVENGSGEPYNEAAERGDFRSRRFLARKPANGFRVFVFGGSSEAGTPYGYDHSFAEYLRALLTDALPGRAVEVVNCAAPGYASRRLLYLAEEVSAYEPDLFIVSTGHNELVEQRLYAHLFDYPPWLFEAQQALRRLHITGLLESVIDGMRDAGGTEVDAEEIYAPMFGPMGSKFWQDEERDAERQRFYALEMFETNVERVIRAGREAGARVLLLSQAKNYADWPTTDTAHRKELSPEKLAAFEAQVARADELETAGDSAGAIEALERAVAIDRRFVPTQQRLGDLHRARGEFDAARARYVEAHNTSLANFGTTPARNRILAELAERHGTLWVDIARIYEEASPGGLVGFNLFIDFLHPNLAGHQLIAQSVFARVREAGVPEPAPWREPAPLPTPEELRAADPAIHGQELRIRIVAEILSERADVAAALLEELKRVAPEDTQLPRLESWIAGELPFDLQLLYQR